MQVGKWLAVVIAFGIATISCSEQDFCAEPSASSNIDIVFPTTDSVVASQANQMDIFTIDPSLLSQAASPSEWISTHNAHTTFDPSHSTASVGVVSTTTQDLKSESQSSPNASPTVPTLTATAHSIVHSALALCIPHGTGCPSSNNTASTTSTTTSTAFLTTTRTSRLTVTSQTGSGVFTIETASPSAVQPVRRSCGSGQTAVTRTASVNGGSDSPSSVTGKTSAELFTTAKTTASISGSTGKEKVPVASASTAGNPIAQKSGSVRNFGLHRSMILLFGYFSALGANLLLR